MKFMEDNSILWEMFEELLLKASDRERNSQAHPAFVHIISQLSHDEAVLLWKLKEEGSFLESDIFYPWDPTNRVFDRAVTSSEVPHSSLDYPRNSELYRDHLKSLNLVSWNNVSGLPSPSSGQGTLPCNLRLTRWELTDFGELFVECCIPPKGYRNLSETRTSEEKTSDDK